MPKSVSASAMARHIDLSRERIAQLVEEGVLTKNADATFDQDSNRRAYIRFLRNIPARSGQKYDRLYEAKAKLVELRERKLRNELMAVAPCQDYLTEMFIEPMLAGLDAIPSKFCGRDMQGRRRLKAMLDELRNSICDICDAEHAKLLAEEPPDDEGRET